FEGCFIGERKSSVQRFLETLFTKGNIAGFWGGARGVARFYCAGKLLFRRSIAPAGNIQGPVDA
ncbi:hypothetical protein, partial [Pseudomonas syringae]|uniref:hypothetical protein n=1 Tax=Pseudomonas syringae TaxID=317 RepID=UPI001F3AB646